MHQSNRKEQRHTPGVTGTRNPNIPAKAKYEASPTRPTQ
ncbi:MAG: hypothetical protein RL386_755, partial [Bacteroidota bacterium]